MDQSRGLLLHKGCLARPQSLTIAHLRIQSYSYILLRKVVLIGAETRRETPFVTFVPCDRSQKYLKKLVEEEGNGHAL